MKNLFLSAFALLMFVGGSAGMNLVVINQAYAGGGEAPVEGGAQFFELAPLILPIVDNNGVSQTVSLVIALEVSDPAMLAEIERMSPKLVDAYIQDMYGMLGEHAAMKGGVIQVSKIKKRLGEISNNVLGEHKVDDVLLQVVQQRPI